MKKFGVFKKNLGLALGLWAVGAAADNSATPAEQWRHYLDQVRCYEKASKESLEVRKDIDQLVRALIEQGREAGGVGRGYEELNYAQQLLREILGEASLCEKHALMQLNALMHFYRVHDYSWESSKRKKLIEVLEQDTKELSVQEKDKIKISLYSFIKKVAY